MCRGKRRGGSKKLDAKGLWEEDENARNVEMTDGRLVYADGYDVIDVEVSSSTTIHQRTICLCER